MIIKMTKDSNNLDRDFLIIMKRLDISTMLKMTYNKCSKGLNQFIRLFCLLTNNLKLLKINFLIKIFTNNPAITKMMMNTTIILSKIMELLTKTPPISKIQTILNKRIENTKTLIPFQTILISLPGTKIMAEIPLKTM